LKLNLGLFRTKVCIFTKRIWWNWN